MSNGVRRRIAVLEESLFQSCGNRMLSATSTLDSGSFSGNFDFHLQTINERLDEGGKMSLWFTVRIKKQDGKTVRRSVYRNHTAEFRGPAFEMHQCVPEVQSRETVLRTIAETFRVPDAAVSVVRARKAAGDA
jgi:hypothetical protein